MSAEGQISNMIGHENATGSVIWWIAGQAEILKKLEERLGKMESTILQMRTDYLKTLTEKNQLSKKTIDLMADSNKAIEFHRVRANLLQERLTAANNKLHRHWWQRIFHGRVPESG